MTALLIVGAGRCLERACSLAKRQQLEYLRIELQTRDGFHFSIDSLAPYSPEDVCVFVALDSRAVNTAKTLLIEALSNAGYRLINLIAHDSSVADSVQLGTNIYIGSGTHLLGNVSIGDGAWLESTVLVDHQAAIGSFSTLGLGVTIGEAAKIGRNSTLSAGSHVRPGGVVGEYCEWMLGGKLPPLLPDRSFYDDILPDGARILKGKRTRESS